VRFVDPSIETRPFDLGIFANQKWRHIMGIDRAKIESRFTEIQKLVASSDWRGWADLFAEDGTFINSSLSEPIRGREALHRFVLQFPKVVDREEWRAIDGNRVAVGWNQRPEGARADVPLMRGFSTYVFDDDGLVASYEGMFDTATAYAPVTTPPEHRNPTP
jgi:hypothetical protein